MPDYGSWESSYTEDQARGSKGFEFEAKYNYYRSTYNFIDFDPSIKSSYDNAIRNIVMYHRTEKSASKDAEDLEDDIQETMHKHAIDTRNPAKRPVSLADVHIAYKKWQQTIPFTPEAAKAREEYEKIKYNYNVLQPESHSEFGKALERKHVKLNLRRNKATSAKKEYQKYEAERDAIIKDMEERFKEIDKLIALKKAIGHKTRDINGNDIIIGGVKKVMPDGTVKYTPIDQSKFDAQTMNNMALYEGILRNKSNSNEIRGIKVTRNAVTTMNEQISDLNAFYNSIVSKINQKPDQKDILDKTTSQYQEERDQEINKTLAEKGQKR